MESIGTLNRDQAPFRPLSLPLPLKVRGRGRGPLHGKPGFRVSASAVAL